VNKENKRRDQDQPSWLHVAQQLATPASGGLAVAQHLVALRGFKHGSKTAFDIVLVAAGGRLR